MLLDFDDCAFDGSPTPSCERRHHHRRGSGLRAHLFPDLRDDDASDELEVVSLNINRHGVGMELSHDVPVGAVLNIEIGSGGQTVQSPVRIVSCDPIADGLYRAGGEFC